MNEKIRKNLRSVITIGVVAVVLTIGTVAFFSDTETSIGNFFGAGAIDLQIDNESYVTNVNGVLVASPETSWDLRDLTIERFFNFTDVKPGDIGEDTISIHVNNNDAYVCAAAQITEDSDVDYTEPELSDDPTVNEGDPQGTDGELAENMNFAFWADDGDNVYEVGESIFLGGPISNIGQAGQIALADSQTNVWNGQSGPILGGETFYIGKAWCFGDLIESPIAQDNQGKTGSNGPLDRGTGFACNGAPEATNAAQTDSVRGDIEFYAVQSRNNSEFSCASWEPSFEGNLPEENLVGAALDEYVAPACDETVDNVGELVTEVGNATEDETICLNDGDYDLSEPLVLDTEGLTLAGVNGPLNTATVTGGLYVNADNVTITGLELDGYDFIESSENAAIYVNSDISGTTVSYNLITSPDGNFLANAKGLVTEIGNGGTPGASGLSIMHNRFTGWNQGIFYNTANHETAHNDFYGNNVGVANDGPHNSSIHHNDFEGNVAEAVGVNASFDNGTGNNGVLTVNINNMVPGGAGNNVNWYGSSVSGGADIDATENYWGDEAPVARTNNTAEVETTPAALVAYPEN